MTHIGRWAALAVAYAGVNGAVAVAAAAYATHGVADPHAAGQVVTASLYDAGDTVVGGAEHHFQLATEILRAIGNDTELAKGLEAYARYLIEHGDSKRGKTLLHEALVVFTRLGLGARGQAVGQLLSAID